MAVVVGVAWLRMIYIARNWNSSHIDQPLSFLICSECGYPCNKSSATCPECGSDSFVSQKKKSYKYIVFNVVPSGKIAYALCILYISFTASLVIAPDGYQQSIEYDYIPLNYDSVLKITKKNQGLRFPAFDYFFAIDSTVNIVIYNEAGQATVKNIAKNLPDIDDEKMLGSHTDGIVIDWKFDSVYSETGELVYSSGAEAYDFDHFIHKSADKIADSEGVPAPSSVVNFKGKHFFQIVNIKDKSNLYTFRIAFIVLSCIIFVGIDIGGKKKEGKKRVGSRFDG